MLLPCFSPSALCFQLLSFSHVLACISTCRRRTDWFDDRNEALLAELLQAYPQVRVP